MVLPRISPRASLSTRAGYEEVVSGSRSRWQACLPGLVTGNSRLKPESLGSVRDGTWRGTREAVTREQERGQKRKTGGQDANAQLRAVLNTTSLVPLL